MKICLVRPPSIVNPVSYIAALTPPIGICYLASTLRESGHKVIIIDAVGENLKQSIPISSNLVLRGLSFDEIVDRIPDDTDIIGISGMFSSEWTHIRTLVNLIGKVFPDKFFVAGGEHFTAAAKFSMEQCPALDACVIGEGEETLLDLVDILEKKENIGTVKGLVIRKNGGYHNTGNRSRIREIDQITNPAWDLVPLNNYLDNLMGWGVDRGRSIPMLASRGCPYECTFCSNPMMWGKRWLARDPKKVVDEIEGYIEKYSITNIDFYDLTAIVKRDWILAFAKELIQRNVRITWQLPSGTRSEAIDREVAQWMYRSGCRNVSYAPESGSERVLVQIKKKLSLSNLFKSLRGTVAEGLNVKLNIIIGLPDETHLDIWKTILLLVKISWYGGHDVSVGVFAPYPGSTLYDRLVEEGKISYSNEYFEQLAYVDITETVSYCDAVSTKWLRIYNWLAFAIFYGTNYLFRPQRLFRTARNLVKDEHESRGEMALGALLGRLKLSSSSNLKQNS